MSCKTVQKNSTRPPKAAQLSGFFCAILFCYSQLKGTTKVQLQKPLPFLHYSNLYLAF